MRGSMIEDPHLQAERRRMGGDRWDEVCAALDVREVMLIPHTLAVELYDCASGAPKRVEPANSAVLDCTFTRLDGNRLDVVTATGTVVVSP